MKTQLEAQPPCRRTNSKLLYALYPLAIAVLSLAVLLASAAGLGRPDSRPDELRMVAKGQSAGSTHSRAGSPSKEASLLYYSPALSAGAPQYSATFSSRKPARHPAVRAVLLLPSLRMVRIEI